MRRAYGWLLAAIVLFALSALLMWLGDRKKTGATRPRHADAEFPNRPSRSAIERSERRRVQLPGRNGEDAAAARPRDPLLVALVPRASNSFVVEIGAIRDAPLGTLLLECAVSGEARKSFEDVKRSAGIDLLHDVDRVAVSNDTIFATGDFRGARWSELNHENPSRYGDQGTLFGAADGGDASRALGTWGSNLLIGGSVAEIRRAMDRLESRATPEPMPIDPSATYGEVYGTFSGEVLANMLPDPVKEQTRSYAKRVELHVDATGDDDVLLVGDVSGPDATHVADLGKSLGGALSLGRLAAEHEGNDELRELLDVSRVTPEKGTFRVETAVPLALLRRQLCGRPEAP